jgi:hypothetical protein
MKTLITLEIEHRRPIEHLEDLVAGRAYTLDNVTNVLVVATPTGSLQIQAPRVLTEEQQVVLQAFFDAF